MLAFALNGERILYSNLPSGESHDADESASVASALGISRSYVSRIEKNALEILKEALKNES